MGFPQNDTQDITVTETKDSPLSIKMQNNPEHQTSTSTATVGNTKKQPMIDICDDTSKKSSACSEPSIVVRNISTSDIELSRESKICFTVNKTTKNNDSEESHTKKNVKTRIIHYPKRSMNVVNDMDLDKFTYF